MSKIAIIGGGAAGFWAAITAKTHYPALEVCILEKTSKYLSKVKVSGGGRCNVTHACFEPSALAKFYPRGGKALKKAFRSFMPQDMMQWLEKRGVALKTESDGRVFPQSDDSQTIIDCFLKECQKLKIQLLDRHSVEAIEPQEGGSFVLQMVGKPTIRAQKVIICTGGSPKLSGLDWLKDLGHKIVPPVPSLFTFNMPDEPIKELMGLSHPESQMKVQSSKLKDEGALLITHWGMSGPSV
ncbi:MAG: aminoacetone oxidase family FAD-binding enzyme, partial [Bacteroidota bacterium]